MSDMHVNLVISSRRTKSSAAVAYNKSKETKDRCKTEVEKNNDLQVLLVMNCSQPSTFCL